MSLSTSRAGYFLKKLILLMVRWKRIYTSHYRSKEKLMAKYAAKFNHIKNANMIPIGSDCMLAFNLSYWGLLKHNFGLEHVITENIATVTKLINNQFGNFFSLNHLKYCPLRDRVIETFYNVYSLHDYELKDQFMQEHEAVWAKFERRIQRFKRALTDSNPIILLRYDDQTLVTNDEIMDLLSAINNNYSGLCVYLFMIVTNKNRLSRPLSINTAKVYYIHYKVSIFFKVKHRISRWLELAISPRWTGDRQAWKKVFIKINKLLAN